MSTSARRRRKGGGSDDFAVDPSLFLSRSYGNIEEVMKEADTWAESQAAIEAAKARPWGALARTVGGAEASPPKGSLKGISKAGGILEIMASVSSVNTTVTKKSSTAAGGPAADGSIVKKKKKKKLRKRPPLPPLLKTSNPIVRIDAASTVLRPPRAAFGYCAISGSFRDHFTTGGLNKPADRLLVCDNFLGCNEQSLFGCFEGIGINGTKTADFLASALPAIVEAVAAEHSKRRKRKAVADGPVSFGAPKDPIARLNVAAKSILQFLADSDDDEGPPNLHKGPSGGKPPAHPSKQGGAKKPKKKIIEKLADVSADVVGRVHSILSGGMAGAHAAAASLGLAPGTLDLPDGRYNGASLCFALIRGDNLVVANIGGCRAVIGAEVDAVAVAALLPNAPAVAAAAGGRAGSPRGRSASPSRVGTAAAAGMGGLTTMGGPNSSIAIMDSQEMSLMSSTANAHAGAIVPRTSHSAKTGLSHLGDGGAGGDAGVDAQSSAVEPATAAASAPSGGGGGGASVPRTIRLLQDVSVMDISVLRAPGAVQALAKHAVDAAQGKHNKGSLFKGSRAGTKGGANAPDLTPEQAAAALGLVAGGSSTLVEAAARRDAVLHPASTADFPALPPVVRDALWFPEETYVEPVKALSLHRAAAVQARRAEVGERIVKIAAKTAADYSSLSETASISDLPPVGSFVATLPNGEGLVAAAASMTDSYGGGVTMGGGILKAPGSAGKRLPSLRLTTNPNNSNNSLPPSAVGAFRLPSAAANGPLGRSPSRRTVLHDSLSLHDGGGSVVAPSNWHSLSVLDKVRGSAVATELEHPSIADLKQRRADKEREEVKAIAAANILAAAESEQAAIRKKIEEQQAIMAGYAGFKPNVSGAENLRASGPSRSGVGGSASASDSGALSGAVSAVDNIAAGGGGSSAAAAGGSTTDAGPGGKSSSLLRRRLSDATEKTVLTREGALTNTPAYIPILATTKVPIKELRPVGAGTNGGIVKGDGTGVGGPVGNPILTLQTLVASPFAVDFSVPPAEHAEMPLAEEVRQKYALLYQHQAHLAGRPPPGAEKPVKSGLGGMASKLAALKNGTSATSDGEGGTGNGKKTPNSPSSPQSPRSTSRSPSRSPSQMGSRGVSFAGGRANAEGSPSPRGGSSSRRSPSPGRGFDEHGSDDLFRSDTATPAGNQNPARGWLRTPKDAAYVKSFGDNLRSTMSGDLRQAVAAVSSPTHPSYTGGGPASRGIGGGAGASRDSMTFEARRIAAAKEFEQSGIARAYRVRPMDSAASAAEATVSGLAGLLMAEAFNGNDEASGNEDGSGASGYQSDSARAQEAVGLLTSGRDKSSRNTEPEVIGGIVIPVIADVPPAQPFPGMKNLAAASNENKPQLPRLNLQQAQQQQYPLSKPPVHQGGGLNGTFGVAGASGAVAASGSFQMQTLGSNQQDNDMAITRPARGDSIASSVDFMQQKATAQLMADAASAAFAGMNVGTGLGMTRLAKGLQSGIVGLSKKQALLAQQQHLLADTYQLEHQQQMQALASSEVTNTDSLIGLLDMTPRGLVEPLGHRAVPQGRHAKEAMAKAIADGSAVGNPEGKFTAREVAALSGYGGDDAARGHPPMPGMLPLQNVTASSADGPPSPSQGENSASLAILPGSATSSIIDFSSIGSAPSFAAEEAHQGLEGDAAHSASHAEQGTVSEGDSHQEGQTLGDGDRPQSVHTSSPGSPPRTSPTTLTFSASPSRSGLRTSGTFGGRSGILKTANGDVGDLSLSVSPSRIGTTNGMGGGFSPGRTSHSAALAITDPMGSLPKPPAPGYLQDIRYYNDAGKPIRMCLPLVLTIDHRPDRPEETARVLASGGRVAMAQYEGGRRGHLPRVYTAGLEGPGLTVSRCVGYTSASTLGVIATPDVITHKIQPNDRFMIVATDGLWAVMSSEEAVRIVAKTIDSVLWGGGGDPKLQAIAALERRQKAAEERERLVIEAASDAEEETAAQLLSPETQPESPVAGKNDGDDDYDSSRAPTPLTPGTGSGSRRGAPTELALVETPASQADGFITGSSTIRRAGLTDTITLESTVTARNEQLDGSWIQSATTSLFSNPSLSMEDAKLIADAAVLDPTKAPQQRSVAAPVAHPAPLTHETPSPAIEARISISAGEGPAAGSGGGTAMPMDLAESLLPENARALRLQRRRTTSLAAAEALMAAARVKWKEAMAPGSSTKGGAASNTPWDDIAVMVILFEH